MIAKLFGGFIRRRAFVPLHFESLAALYGCPGAIGQNGDAAIGGGTPATGLNREDLANAVNSLRLCGVEGSNFSIEDGTARDDRIDETRRTRINAKLRGPGGFGGGVDAMSAVADDGEIARILEGNVLEIWNGEQRGVGGELAVSIGALGMAMDDVALFRSTSIGIHFPFFRGRRDEHFASSGSRLAQRQPRTGNAPAATGTKIIDFGIRRRLLDMHLAPIET